MSRAFIIVIICQLLSVSSLSGHSDRNTENGDLFAPYEFKFENLRAHNMYSDNHASLRIHKRSPHIIQARQAAMRGGDDKGKGSSTAPGSNNSSSSSPSPVPPHNGSHSGSSGFSGTWGGNPGYEGKDANTFMIPYHCKERVIQRIKETLNECNPGAGHGPGMMGGPGGMGQPGMGGPGMGYNPYGQHPGGMPGQGMGQGGMGMAGQGMAGKPPQML